MNQHDVRQIRRYTSRKIKAGPGIIVNEVGDNLVITADPSRVIPITGTSSSATVITKGKVHSLSVGGADNILVKLWDFNTDWWSSELTAIKKPRIFQPSWWDGETLTHADGRLISYTKINEYTRLAKWTDDDGDQEEYQAITEPYVTEIADPEILTLYRWGADWEDMNTAGRHWARVEEEEEKGT